MHPVISMKIFWNKYIGLDPLSLNNNFMIFLIYEQQYSYVDFPH